MITLKDLQNRVYSDKECIRFEYIIEVNKQENFFVTFFKQCYIGAQPNEWKMQVIVPRTRDKDSEVYNFGYVMPKDDLPLTLIAATGLRYFQLHIQEEVQQKSNLDFVLGEIIKGM